MTPAIVNTTVSALQIAAQLAPIPFLAPAAQVLQSLVNACNQIQVHKGMAEGLVARCAQLLSIFIDETLEGASLQGAIDQVTSVLENVHGKVLKISLYTYIQTYMKSDHIAKVLQSCQDDLNTAMEVFQMKSAITISRRQTEVELENKQVQDEMLTLLRTIVHTHTKGDTAIDVVRKGRRDVMLLQEAEANKIEQEARPPGEQDDDEEDPRFAKIKEYSDLLEELDLPSEISNLNGQTTRKPGIPDRNGLHSDVYIGTYKGEKVALKYLRQIRNDAKSERYFKREILVWSKLKHKNILPFYGLTTDYNAKICIVSQWQENADIKRYCKTYPDANRLDLLCGAAKGIEYLHSEHLAHGNLKCSNILISAEGVPVICDFGMTKSMGDITQTSITVTLAQGNGLRWAAPELMQAVIPWATRSTDVYSFALTILEGITLAPPFAEIHNDVPLVLAVNGPQRYRPMRPVASPGVDRWLTDELWGLMQRMWAHEASTRPGMEEVVSSMESIAYKTAKESMPPSLPPSDGGKIRDSSLRCLITDSERFFTRVFRFGRSRQQRVVEI